MTANKRDCDHGQLARSCNICELEKEIEELKEGVQYILSIEEEGHRFSSDDALAEIFNKCRDILI